MIVNGDVPEASPIAISLSWNDRLETAALDWRIDEVALRPAFSKLLPTLSLAFWKVRSTPLAVSPAAFAILAISLANRACVASMETKRRAVSSLAAIIHLYGQQRHNLR